MCLLCLFSFLLAALLFCSYWNSNLVPLSIYLSIFITFLYVQGSFYIGYCSSFTIAMDVYPLQRVLVSLLWFNSCLLQIVTVFIFNDSSTFWLTNSPLQPFHAAHQLHLEFCGLFITWLSILIQFLDCCRNELIQVYSFFSRLVMCLLKTSGVFRIYAWFFLYALVP